MALEIQQYTARLIGNDPATGKPLYGTLCPESESTNDIQYTARLIGNDPATGKPLYAISTCLPAAPFLALARLDGNDPATGKPVYVFVEDCCESGQGSSSSSQSKVGCVACIELDGYDTPLPTTIILTKVSQSCDACIVATFPGTIVLTYQGLTTNVDDLTLCDNPPAEGIPLWTGQAGGHYNNIACGGTVDTDFEICVRFACCPGSVRPELAPFVTRALMGSSDCTGWYLAPYGTGGGSLTSCDPLDGDVFINDLGFGEAFLAECFSIQYSVSG